jgi:hypothetical protein
VKGSTSTKSKALVKGKGANLPDPVLGAITYPVVVQLVNNDSGVCLEGSFDALDEIKNTTTQFKAKAQ